MMREDYALNCNCVAFREEEETNKRGRMHTYTHTHTYTTNDDDDALFLRLVFRPGGMAESAGTWDTENGIWE